MTVPGRTTLGGLLLGLLLAACSGGTNVPSLELQVIEAGRSAVADQIARRQARSQPAAPPLTRAVLDTLEGSFMEVTRERVDQVGYLFVSATRRDDSPGRITVWRTEDGISLAMRNGVLIATRGLGGDILSSTVQVTGDRPGPSRGGERVHYIAARDNREQRLPMACTLTDLGPRTIVIVERAQATRHLRETCTAGAVGPTGRGGTIVNDYWVDSQGGGQGGRVWQSRQWAGPHIGYLRLRRLTD